MSLFPRAVRNRLAWAAAASVALPWAAGAWVKHGIESQAAFDAARRVLLIDYLVAGTILAALSMWLTVAVGCWVTAVMKGPRRMADSFPVDSPRRGP